MFKPPVKPIVGKVAGTRGGRPVVTASVVPVDGREGVLQVQRWIDRYWLEVADTRSRAVAVELLAGRVREAVQRDVRAAAPTTAAAFLLGFLVTPLLSPDIQGLWRGVLHEAAELVYTPLPPLLRAASIGPQSALHTSPTLHTHIGSLVEGDLFFNHVYRLAAQCRVAQSNAARRKVVNTYLKHTLMRVVDLWQHCIQRDVFHLWRGAVAEVKRLTSKNKRVFRKNSEKVSVRESIANWRRVARMHHLRNMNNRNAQLLERIAAAAGERARTQERLRHLQEEVAVREARRGEIQQQCNDLGQLSANLEKRRAELVSWHYDIRREWQGVLLTVFGDLRLVPASINDWMGSHGKGGGSLDTHMELKERVEARRSRFTPESLLHLTDEVVARGADLLPPNATPQELAAAVSHQLRVANGGIQQCVRSTDLLRGDQYNQELAAALLLQLVAGGHCRAFEPYILCETAPAKPTCGLLHLEHPHACSGEVEIMLADWQRAMLLTETAAAVGSHTNGAIRNAIHIGGTVQAHRLLHHLYERLSSMTPSGEFPRDAVENAVRSLVPAGDWPLVELLYPAGGITTLGAWGSYVSDVAEVESWDVGDFLVWLEEAVQITPLMEFAAQLEDPNVRAVFRPFRAFLDALFNRHSQEVEVPAAVGRTNTWKDAGSKPPARRRLPPSSKQQPGPTTQRLITRPGFNSLLAEIKSKVRIHSLGDDDIDAIFTVALKKRVAADDAKSESGSIRTDSGKEEEEDGLSSGISHRGLTVLFALVAHYDNPCPFTTLPTKLTHLLSRLTS